jgi:predicted permease
LFAADDDRAPRADVVVLSYELWTTRFGADSSVVGRVYTMNGTPYRVVGVLGKDFHPFRMANPAEEPRIYAPLGDDPTDAARCRACASVSAVGRLADGASIAGARNEITAAMRQFRDEHPADFARNTAVQVEPLTQHLTGAFEPALWIALGAAACVLLVGCVNLANLQLARSSARASEFALRGALGGSHVRVARAVLFESALLGVAGCAAGVVLGRIGLDALTALAPRELPRLGEIAMDARVLVAAALTGVATAVTAGVAPARDAARADLNDALKHRGQAGVTHALRGRGALVVSEVALAFVLVTATGLLIRSVSRLLSVDVGFDSGHVLTMTPVVTGTRQMAAAAMLNEKQRMVDAVRGLPGVTAAAMVNDVPLTHTTPIATAIEGRATPPGQAPPMADVFWVEGDYFSALRIPLRRGRLLTRHDGTDAPPAVVVSESFARQEFPAGDALGHRIRLDVPPSGESWLTIVGVVADVKNLGLDRPAGVATARHESLPLHPHRRADRWRSLVDRGTNPVGGAAD